MSKSQNKSGRGRAKGTQTDLRQLDLWGQQQSQKTEDLDSQEKVSPPAQSSQLSENTSKKSEPSAKHAIKNSANNKVTKALPKALKRTSSTEKPFKMAALPQGRTRGLRSGAPALTKRQQSLVTYLANREKEHLAPACLPEICRDLGLASRGSLHKQIVALVEAGLVEPLNGKQRGVRLIHAANDDEFHVPLLGNIAAGFPIEALSRDEIIGIPTWMKPNNACYALRVRGDSMRDCGVLDGDYVVIEPRAYARNGEVVVALIDGEQATLKRLEHREGMVHLYPENPDYPVLKYAAENVQIQGVLVGQFRRYGP